MHPFVKVSFIGPKQYFKYFTYDHNSPESYYNTTGYGIGVGSRFYQSSTPASAYISPMFDYYYYKKHKPSTDGLLTFANEYILSLQVGKQWVYKNRLILDAYTGAGFAYRQYREIIEDTEVQTADYAGAGFKPYLGLQIGYKLE